MPSKNYLKAMTLKDEIGLTDEERRELTLMIPGLPAEHSGSWRDLDDKQMHDLLTMLEGYLFITYLMIMRPPLLLSPDDE